jgi:signal transduction histidine kinase
VTPRSYQLTLLVERITPWLVLMILAFFTYARFFVVPYSGFEFSDGRVLFVFDTDRQAELLQTGDRLLRVDSVWWEDFQYDFRKTILDGYKTGQPMSILVERGGEQVHVNWVYTGPTREQIMFRLSEHWWLPYIFWFAGLTTLLYIRPKDIRWQTLIALYFLTAIWFTAGSGNAHWHIWGSPDVFFTAVLLSLPVYLHFHWVFPHPLLKLPSLFWKLLYAGTVLLVILGWFELLPLSIFRIVFILLPAGSVFLLILHAIFQKTYRALVFLLAAGIAIVLIPPVLFGFIDDVLVNTNLRASSFIALPAFPAAYFFAIYWLQNKQSEQQVKRLFGLYVLVILVSTLIVLLFAYYEFRLNISSDYLFHSIPSILLSFFVGLISILPFMIIPANPRLAASPSSRSESLELRSNRLFSFYLFFSLLGLVLTTLVVLSLAILPPSRDSSIAVAMTAAVLAIVTTSLGFEPFQRSVERRLLGITLAPTQLLETYSASITTSLDVPRLTHLLRDQLLPSLFVFQSALLRLDESKHLSPLYLSGVGAADLPLDPGVLDFLRASGSSGPISSFYKHTGSGDWIRIAFPLRIRDKLVGLWLLGRRDPDDYYAPSELSVLKSIANQTAVALANIQQAELLRDLYQANIERQESGDSALALFLHDEVLNSLAQLLDQIDPGYVTPRVQQIYNQITSSLRQTIQGLHPTMLAYGLSIGLEDLVDDLAERAGENFHIELQVSGNNNRYDPRVEQHLYRIVQQACENALRHARAKTLRICGRIDPDEVFLEVVDDGVGFPASELEAFSSLIARRHFGLFGIYQRAGFIGAQVGITSAPGAGTRVSVSWSPENLTANGGRSPIALP